jgi:hypothetical protein
VLFNFPVLSVEVLNMKEYHAQDCAMVEAANYQPLTLEARAHPGQSLLSFWRTKEQWDWFFSKYCSFALSLSFYQSPIFIYVTSAI